MVLLMQWSEDSVEGFRKINKYHSGTISMALGMSEMRTDLMKAISHWHLSLATDLVLLHELLEYISLEGSDRSMDGFADLAGDQK